MSMNASGPRLAALTKDLLARWRQTRETWTDAKAREFEDRFMAELECTVSAALSSIGHLEDVLQKIKTDCEQAAAF
jgi:hypothetical protein